MLRCVYTDLDGTLLGRDGSLFHDGDGRVTDRPSQAVAACHAAGAEIVMASGRPKARLENLARTLGLTSFAYELGAGLVVDHEDRLLTAPWQPADGVTIWEQVDRSGAPSLLLDAYPGRLEPHDPHHRGRQVTHLMRGRVDPDEATDLLRRHGHATLRVVDNGATSRRRALPGMAGTPHVYHLAPKAVSKAAAVAAHMRARAYARDQCIAVGNSLEDAGMAKVAGRFFLVAAPGDDKALEVAGAHPSLTVTRARGGDGFHEAVTTALAG